MIEKLELGYGNVKPSDPVVDLVKKLKAEKEKLVVAEIGIGWGATAVEIVKLLSSKDEYVFFDFENAVKELEDDLNKINKNQVKLRGYGNSEKNMDSYAWNLAKLLSDRENAPQFDLVYLDGAHTFMHDGITVCMLKEMICGGGVFSTG